MPVERPASPLRVTRTPFAIATVLLAGAAATLVLPYFVPVSPAISESYLVGFNNRVCFAVFVVFVLFFSWWTEGFGLTSPGWEMGAYRTKPAVGLLLGVLTAFLGATTVEWLLVRAHPAMNEAIYLLDRLQQLESGRLPFAEFEFAYGPLLLYVPLLVSRALHMSVSDAYYISWIAEYGVGVAIVYGTVAMLPALRAQKNVIFLLLACSWWAGPLSFGCNYTPIRYFLAPLLALAATRRIASQRGGVRVGLELLAGLGLVLLVSPEQALAFCGAMLVFLVLAWWHERSLRLVGVATVFALGSGLVLAVCDRAGLFLTLGTVQHGGYNFPLLPVVQHIPIVALLLVAGAALVNNRRLGNKPAELDMLILLGLFVLPAAFGRSDIGHFLVNSTPALIAAWCLLAPHPMIFRSMSVAYTVLVLLLPAPGILRGAALAQRGDRRTALVHFAVNEGRAAEAPLAPLGRPMANSSGLPSPRADTGYYYGLINVTLPFQVEQKIREMEAAPGRELLLPNEFSCGYALDREALRRTLSTIYVPPARRTSGIYDPLCAYIHLHYKRSEGVSSLWGYQTWQPLVGGRP